jgi:DHA1 family multidrug resistance protein-like MFS transporter
VAGGRAVYIGSLCIGKAGPFTKPAQLTSSVSDNKFLYRPHSPYKTDFIPGTRILRKMSYLFSHSTVGTLVQYAKKGKLDYSRSPGKAISTSSSSDNVPTTLVNTSTGTDLRLHQTSLVGWSGPDDPSMPHNWPLSQRVIMTFIIGFYTFAVYVGSSIYTSSQPDVEKIFNKSSVEGSLGIALYVLGYGVGCLLFSPLSEIPAVGRNPPYAISGFLFVILCIPTALVNNFEGLMVLRFLLGFMASPCLATAGVSNTHCREHVKDIY